MSEEARILIVDDLRTNRLKLMLGLKQQGHQVGEAESGPQALDMLDAEVFDLVILDILMPEMDGYEVLRRMKKDESLRNIPVIIISAQDEMESVAKGIELGAEDYLPKNYDPILLKARIDASLEKKRLRDQERAHLLDLQIERNKEQAYARELEREREKSEQLLLNILPVSIAERLKHNQGIIADHFKDASVMFIDIVNFTPLATQMPPDKTIAMLNHIFSTFDSLVDKYKLEKIKTNGDSYMVAGGIPTSFSGHLEAMANMALDVLANTEKFTREDGAPFRVRIGIHSGPVVAGVIGVKKFIYDLWGDTVNTASRMESQGMPNAIQTTQSVYEALNTIFEFNPRGEIDIKGMGSMTTYFLIRRKR